MVRAESVVATTIMKGSIIYLPYLNIHCECEKWQCYLAADVGGDGDRIDEGVWVLRCGFGQAQFTPE